MLRPRTLPAGFIEPCLPTSAKRQPSGKGWLHEIKHDGFRCIVRLYSRLRKGLALWRAAKGGDMWWFIALRDGGL